MKRFITYMFTLLIAMSCSKKEMEETVYADNEGAIEMNITLSTTRATTDTVNTLLEANSVLKIYSVASDGTESLVRRYEPATETPDVLYLTAGDYFATLRVGDSSDIVTSDVSKLCYYGECDIEVEKGKSNAITLDCYMRNSIVEVLLDESIGNSFAEGYSLRIVASDEGTFSDTVFDESDLTAEFTESGEVYFLMDGDDAPSTLLWQFSGQRSIEGTLIDASPITISGKSSAPSPREKSLLTFKYSNYLEFTSEFLTVDFSTEDYDDSFSFSPQPTISAVDFAIAEAQPTDKSLSFTVRGLNPLTYVEVSIDGTTAESGVDFSIDESNTTIGYLTVSSDLFGTLASGEMKSVRIDAYDEENSEGTLTVIVASTGVSSLSQVDYWLNTAKVTGVVVGSATDVTLEYRKSGSSEWLSCGEVTSAGYGCYEATINPTWSDAYSNGSYSLLSGVMAGNTYETRMIVDEVEYTNDFSSGGTQHTITGPENDDDNSCYGTSNSSSTTWCSGNNSFVSGLCSYSSGSSLLTAKAASGTFAAGNLVYGQFEFNGISLQTGTLRFGQAFTWTSRPKSFKFTYKSTIGTCDYIENSGSHPLTSGSTDPARVYFAIVDWSTRHGVTAGSGAPSGVWDPETKSYVAEGNIIGYASMFITASQSSFVEEEIEIFYYDKTTKPSNNITIVVSAVTSAYGDYLSGSTSNRLYVKDFGFGY